MELLFIIALIAAIVLWFMKRTEQPRTRARLD